MNIYQYLKQDHARQRVLANAILDTPPVSSRRYRLFIKFKDTIRRHADVEARTLYATLMQIPRAHPIAREGIQGQRRLAKALQELEHYPVASHEWTLRFLRLRDLLEKQQCEEEELHYPAAQRLLTERVTVDRMTRLYRECLLRRDLPETAETRLCAGKHRPIPPVDAERFTAEQDLVCD